MLDSPETQQMEDLLIYVKLAIVIDIRLFVI